MTKSRISVMIQCRHIISMDGSWNANRKSYVMYQSATLLMTLDDSEGHSSLEGHHLEQRSSVV